MVTESIRRTWTSRWIRAAGVACVMAAASACNSNVSPPAGAPVAEVDGVQRWSKGAGPLANLGFVLKDADGHDVKLASFKGKPLLVNFWATWCGPCRAEMPWFSEFATKYTAQNFTVLGISVDDSPEEIRKFAAENHVSYPLLVGKEHEEIAKAYDATEYLPVSWFIRPDGKVLVKVRGIHDKVWFQEQIEALF
ncbi:MAG: TlpA disulfide reductase family protein [Vicinamibacterales bacterium]